MSPFLDPQIAKAQKSQYMYENQKYQLLLLWCTFFGGAGAGGGEEGHFKVIPIPPLLINCNFLYNRRTNI